MESAGTDGGLFSGFSAKAVAVLDTLLTPGAVIMLTSSHKSSYSLAEWKDIFARGGIRDVDLKSLLHKVMNGSRKDEILNWFAANKIPQ